MSVGSFGMKDYKISINKLLQNLLIVLIFALVVMMACGILPIDKGSWSFLGRDKEVLSVHFITPDDEIVIETTRGTRVDLEPAEEIDNYTFIGWRDAQGNMEKRDSIKVYQNTYYSAVYAVALQTDSHMAYLFPNEYGMYLPYGEMTRSDAAIMLYTLLAVPIKGNEGFLDVSVGDACYEAVCALKELGVVSGSRFHPDEGITLAELLDMIAAFYPACRDDHAFADIKSGDSRYPAFNLAAEHDWIDSGSRIKADPDHIMTRVETATLMNRVLGRAEEPKAALRQVGYMIDMGRDEEGYWHMAEACVPHSFRSEDGVETWTESTPVKKTRKGLYMFGMDLYAVNNEGLLVKDGEWNGFAFDDKGIYTSGDPELDELIKSVFSKILDESMDEEEMLHTIYQYTVDSFTYRRRNSYAMRDSSWAVKEAYTMLSTKCGNCYNFAATFCMMARAIGYDAKVYSGIIGLDRRPHAWVEIKIKGTTYLFDPELEFAYKQNKNYIDMYRVELEDAKKWSYGR